MKKNIKSRLDKAILRIEEFAVREINAVVSESLHEFFTESKILRQPTSGTALQEASNPSHRILKKKRHTLMPSEWEKVREVFGKLKAGTPEWNAKRNEVCKQLAITPRQIGGALSRLGRGTKKRPRNPADV
ncbi:hypothetical protein IIA94_01260 [Patescibacteria group bacterium]|nr:hypothetical protein [Patescibacteria group bacterium]